MVVQRYYLELILTYQIVMEPLFTVLPNGFLVNDGGIAYVMERVGEMLKVTGPDTCYFILETARGLEQANCALTTFSLLIGN